MAVKNWWRGLTSLFFPTLCPHCGHPLNAPDALLCIACERRLSEHYSRRLAENAVTDRLAGRLPLRLGAAAYTYRTETPIQDLIHALKYHHRPDVGVKLGRRFGQKLKDHPALADADGLVPVPLHARRLHERGYNQAEMIGRGLSESLGIPVFPDALQRRQFKGSQTKRSKLERLENVRYTFQIGKGDFTGHHLILVDDVLTTGATLDFCGQALLEAHEGLRLSLLVLAIAEK